jgi:hypothetical protein
MRHVNLQVSFEGGDDPEAWLAGTGPNLMALANEDLAHTSLPDLNPATHLLPAGSCTVRSASGAGSFEQIPKTILANHHGLVNRMIKWLFSL